MSAGPAPLWQFGAPAAEPAAVLARGGLLAIPTESSYGLAALPGSAAGVEAVYRVKHRDRGKPLPVVVAGLDQLAGLGIDADLPILAPLSAFWPGPLTVVLPLAAGASAGLPAAAGTGTLAVRVPDHPRLRELLRALGQAVTATSANRSGGGPIAGPHEAALLLAGEPAALVVDGGILPGGLPSTLVAPAAGPGGVPAIRVLRAGRLPVERLRERLPVVG